MKSTYQYAVLSHVGLVREKNEDSAAVLSDHNVYVVADGMGGHNRGDVASQVCVESIRNCYDDERLNRHWAKTHKQHRSEKGLSKTRQSIHEYRLWKAVEESNRQIFSTAHQHAHLRDMGTTVVACAFHKTRVYVASVGDSRVYRIRDGNIVQITEDHSLANEYVKMKILRREDLPRFPFKNIIVRALGLSEYVEVDTLYRTTRSDDVYLLCTDGLTDLVDDETICDLVLSSDSLDQACQGLVDKANGAGGIDNTTVLLVRVP